MSRLKYKKVLDEASGVQELSGHRFPSHFSLRFQRSCECFLSSRTKLHCLKLIICKMQIPRNYRGSAQNLEAQVTLDKPRGLVRPGSETESCLLAVLRALGMAGRQRGAAGQREPWAGRAGGSSRGPSGISELGEMAEGTAGTVKGDPGWWKQLLLLSPSLAAPPPLLCRSQLALAAPSPVP